MEDIPLKHCFMCKKDKPAIEENFFPSYLKPGGRNQCKDCHNSRRATYPPSGDPYREKLLAIAQSIQKDERSSFQSVGVVAKATGQNVRKIESDVLDAKLPVFKFFYNGVGMNLMIRQEDAEAYIAANGLNGHEQIASPTPSIVGTPDQCGSCGSTRNIFGDVDKTTFKTYGYLCIKCHRLVQDFQGDAERIRKVLTYIEQTRLSHV